MRAKAITVQQPHAREMTYDGKRLENRSWYTNHRGELWIHAGKSRERGDQFPEGVALVFGAVVARAVLSGCLVVEAVDPHAIIDGFDQEQYREGPFCLVLEEMQVLKKPVPCKGALGLWELPPDVEAECRRQL